MKTFTATEVGNKTGDVLMAAAAGIVSIMKNGKPKFVLLTQEKFDELIANSNSQRSFLVNDMPEEIGTLLDKGIEEYLDEK